MSRLSRSTFTRVAVTITLLLSALSNPAAVLYVDLNSTNPVPPFASWNSAATNIQDAVDVANGGDQVVVADGTYQQGNRLTSDGVANRVVITNSVTLRSVNGASVTSIDGGQAVRCVSLTNGASLVGFTLTRGKGGNGGGVNCASLNELISDCQFISNSGVSGGGVYSGTLNNCTLSGNASGAGMNNQGGGAFGSILNYCTLTGNKTGYNVGTDGGGASGCTLNHCAINNNRADSDWSNGAGIYGCVANNCSFSGNSGTYVWGGAAAYSSLTNCVMTGNTAENGGGGFASTLVNCAISNNVATWGGGSAGGTLYNCIILGNSAAQNGGGSYNDSLYNCTVVGNYVEYSGGGVSSYGAVNCIIVDNTSTFGEPNYSSATAINYCCTTPMPTNGLGNIAVPPLFVNEGANDFHLQTNSPCVETGSNAYGTTTTDFDGNPRKVGNVVDMGAYEFQTPTYFAIQPKSQTNYAGYFTVFTALGVSPLPLTYQWQLNGMNIGGASLSTLNLGYVQPWYAGNYRVIISNPMVTVRSSNAVLTVIAPPPAFLSQPLNLVTNLGSNAVFSVSVFSPYPVSYQWQRDNTNLSDGGRFSGTTSSNLVISGVQLSDASAYQVIAANDYGSVTSAVATLTVLSTPAILAGPTDAIATAFSTATVSVTVTGAPPLFYQWRKNGINLSDNANVSGASGSVLTLSNLQPTDSGQFSIVVSNGYGANISASGTLTVVPFAKWGNTWSPIPADATNLVEISAGGDFGWGEFNLALRGDGKIVPWGDTSYPSTNLPPDATNIIAIAAGDYHGLALRTDGTVIAWGENMHGEATAPPDATNVVALAAGQWHSLALRGDGTVVGWGESVPPPGISNVVAISAGGGFSIALRWDGTVIGWGANYYGATTPPATATNVIALAAGRLHSLLLRDDGNIIGSGDILPPPGITNVAAIVSGNDASLALTRSGDITGWGYNLYGNTTPPANLSNVVALSAKEFHVMALVQDGTSHLAPRLVQQPASCDPLVGQTAILLCHAIGTLPMRFQWFFNSAPLVGQTNYWLSLSGIQPLQDGNYEVIIENDYGSVTSQVAVISERFDAAIASQPVSLSTVLGSNATFSVGMFGLPPFSYQWYFNGAPLTNSAHVSGADTSSLTLAAAQVADGGNYSVVVSNVANSVTSVVATLTILMPAQLTTQPTNQSVLLNSNAVFTVSATGTGSLNYQWQKSGVNLSDGGRLSGANSSTLTISAAMTNDAGDYHVVVSNNYGATTSAPATLTVYVPAQITAQPVSQSVLVGSAASFSVVGTGTALGYQWLHDGKPLSNDSRITGATAATLIVANVQPSDVGGYTALVTNLLSSATSAIASLTPLTVSGASVRYVNLNSTNPAPPYLNWASAATTIQDGVDAAVDGDQIIVADGSYQTGGRVVRGALTNRVVVSKAVKVQSVNGPAVTQILGSGPNNSQAAVRCAYLTNGAALIGFTLSYGATVTAGDTNLDQSGGGAWCETTAVLANCALFTNVAQQFGGGVYGGSLNSCTLSANSATYGGAVYGSSNYPVVLTTCTLSNNWAVYGGAASGQTSNTCALLGCVLATNGATNFGGGASFATLSNCTLTGNSAAGTGGGGVYGSLLNDCTLAGNSTTGAGGGAFASILSNCSLLANSSSGNGGGVGGGVISQCVLAGNSALRGGAAFGTTGLPVSLVNCILTNNSAQYGGGVFAAAANSCALSNCLIAANFATNYGGGIYGTAANACIVNECRILANSAVVGGGVYAGPASSWILNSCLIASNSAANSAGGTLGGTLNNATVVGNSAAVQGGGILQSTVRNSVVFFNQASGGSNWYGGSLTYCCTAPLPAGVGNITNAPILLSFPSGDFRLSSVSPCINSGFNLYATNGADLDGQPRVVGGTVDIGAYEFQPLGRDAFTAWLRQQGLPTDASAAWADPDHDGMVNWQEWVAGTDPANAASVLRVLNVTPSVSGLTVSWSSVPDRQYFVERSTNLSVQPLFSILAENIPGRTGTTSYTDTNAVGLDSVFYRVGVQPDAGHLFTPFSMISYAWLEQYNLPKDGSADFADPDQDGMNNWQEWIAGTNPTNALSVLKMLSPSNNSVGLRISWQSVSSRTYFVQRATNLSAQPAFVTIRSNLTGVAGSTTFLDLTATNAGSYFYRVGVQ
jgi:hypothetical protein